MEPTTLGAGALVAVILQWLKATGALNLVPDKELAPGFNLRALSTLALAIAAGFVTGLIEGGSVASGMTALTAALATHGAGKATPLWTLLDKTAPKLVT